ncbi:HD domain-containing protein [Desulfoluna spongiiphila]|nr:HD domain-containing protein [Desulfoluna spongiiphila]
MNSLTDFILELDALKLVNRRTYIAGGERLENSAEHSWHLAMACWLFATHLKRDVSMEKLIKLALIHDLGEIDPGDTFLYDTARSSAPARERECVTRLAGHKGNAIRDLSALWDEQELGQSGEAALLKVVDRLLPFLHNLTSRGQAWKDHGISKSQVLEAHAFIENAEPDIYAWFLENLETAVSNGWLKNT